MVPSLCTSENKNLRLESFNLRISGKKQNGVIASDDSQQL